MKVGPKKI